MPIPKLRSTGVISRLYNVSVLLDGLDRIDGHVCLDAITNLSSFSESISRYFI